MLSTSKEQSEPQSYEKYLCNCQKKLARNGLKIANSFGCAFRFESDFIFSLKACNCRPNGHKKNALHIFHLHPPASSSTNPEMH